MRAIFQAQAFCAAFLFSGCVAHRIEVGDFRVKGEVVRDAPGEVSVDFRVRLVPEFPGVNREESIFDSRGSKWSSAEILPDLRAASDYSVSLGEVDYIAAHLYIPMFGSLVGSSPKPLLYFDFGILGLYCVETDRGVSCRMTPVDPSVAEHGTIITLHYQGAALEDDGITTYEVDIHYATLDSAE